MKRLTDILEGPNEDRPFEVVHKSGDVIGRYKTLKIARRVADKRDLNYGAIAHSVRRVKSEIGEQHNPYINKEVEYLNALDENGKKMTPIKTPQEKFKAGLKRSGYDPDAGAKRLMDLLAKQKKEREEHEKKYGHLYGESREPKSLRQILEGVVVMADYKLDKRGRKYKAHRKTMGQSPDSTMQESVNPYLEEDSLHEASRYVQGHLVNDDDWYVVHNKTKKIVSTHGNKSIPAKNFNIKLGFDGSGVEVDPEHTAYTGYRIEKAVAVKEDVEQVQEISKRLAASYARKKVSQIGNRKTEPNPKDVENLSRAYTRMSDNKSMKEDVVSESSIQKVTTNPDGTKSVTVKTDAGRMITHTFRNASSINKLLKRRYNIQSSIPEK